MKPDKGYWLVIVNVIAANGLGGACLFPLRLAVYAAEHHGWKRGAGTDGQQFTWT
jgi:hypothetical protein